MSHSGSVDTTDYDGDKYEDCGFVRCGSVHCGSFLRYGYLFQGAVSTACYHGTLAIANFWDVTAM